MIKTLKKDIIIDKYYHGYVTFLKGTKVKILDLDYYSKFKFISVTPLSIVDEEQPISFLVDREDLE